MDVDAASDFIAVLLLGGVVGTTLALAIPALRTPLIDTARPLAALVAVGATAGSLWFSEGAGFVPCELCWFQRIAMYPLAVLLSLAALRRDRAVFPYALALAGGGLAVSLYHVQLQLWPDQSSFCELDNPCSGRWIDALGFLTIPRLAALSFALIIVLVVATNVGDRRGHHTVHSSSTEEAP